MHTPLHEALAYNMKSRRKSLGLTQADLAEAAGVSVGYIGEIEIERKIPVPEVLIVLADALGTRAYRLLMSERDLAEAAGTAGRDQAWALAERLREHLEEEVRELLRPDEPPPETGG